MNVVCLAKRRPLQRDLLQEPYGRFYHLAMGMAKRGHQVHMLLLNYQYQPEEHIERDDMHWHSINLLPDPTRYYRKARSLSKSLQADWIIGFSDTWYGICAESVARATSTHSLIDAYDNYESYMSWCKPLHQLWRAALRRCNRVSAAGPQLLASMCRERADGEECGLLLPMAADPEFTPRSKESARQRLGIPLDQPVVVYCGSMHANRGIQTLLQACEQLQEAEPRIHFLFSGRQDRSYSLPANTRHLGYLDDEQLKDLMASGDLLVSINVSSGFGEFSYPVKLYEAMAMGIPVLASDTPASRYVVQNPNALVPPGDAKALAMQIVEALDRPSNSPALAPGWDRQCDLLDELLCSGLS